MRFDGQWAGWVVAPGFASDTLPLTRILFPTNGATGLPYQPTFTWTGPVNWAGAVSAYVSQSGSSFALATNVPASQTNWTVPIPLPGGVDLTVSASASTNYSTPLFIATTPLNTNDAQPLAGWTSITMLSSLGSATFRSVPVSHTLALWCGFENTNAYAVGTDSSGYGSYPSYASWGSADTADADAKVGLFARRFYGTSSIDYMSPGASFTNVWKVLAGSFSVSVWVKTTNSTGLASGDAYYGGMVFSAYNSHSLTNDTIPISITGGKVAFFTRDGAGNATTLRSTRSVNDGIYHLITVTRDQASGLKTLYIDGQLEGSEIGTTQPLNGNTYDISIGGFYYSYTGLLDDFQLYAGALAASEVAYLYNHPGSVAPFLGSTVALGDALNATNLTWTTSGDANWAGQTSVSHDSTSSAASGPITNLQTSTLQTTVTGPGALVYWWQNASTNSAFSLAFKVDGASLASLSGSQPWVQAGPFQIGVGVHTLAWVASAGGSADPNSTGYVDQVHFAPSVDITNFQLTIIRQANPAGADSFAVVPWIYSVNPAPTTVHTVESPNKAFTCQVGSSFMASVSSRPTLDSVISECTNGQWTLTINKGASNEQQYTFSVSISGLTTNLLGPVIILSPTNGSTGVSVQPPMSWSGPSALPSGFAEVFSATNEAGGFMSFTNAVGNWPAPPLLAAGTNTLIVDCYLNDFPGVTFTRPVDSFLVPVRTWNASASLEAKAISQFVVSPAGPPLLGVGISDNTFSFSFQTQASHSHTIQACTNLAGGVWVDVTNFVGDGSIQQFGLSSTNPPVCFFRLVTK